MRGRGVIRAAAGLGLVAAGLVYPGSPAGATPPARAGWWSQVAPAPAAPDVPEDGLHVAGGVGGPSAIAALAFELPTGAVADTLSLVLAGMSPRADGLQACTIPIDAAGFEPALNGAWDDRPAYDCDAGAVPVVLDGTTATFALGALQHGTVLAIALVPGSTDRTSIERPDDGALTLTTPDTAAPIAVETVAPAASATTTFAGASAVLPTPSFTPPAAPSAPVVPAAAARVVDDAADAIGAVPVVRSAPVERSNEPPLRTRVGGALGFVLLLTVLLFYSQGRGLLGARVGNT